MIEGLFTKEIFHFTQPIDYSIAEQLLQLPKLRVIQFHETKPDEVTLNILNEVVFKKRQDITLRVYGYKDKWADISFLHFLPNVERFSWNTAVFGSVEPLYKLKKLVHLGLGFRQPKKISLKFGLDFKDTLESIDLIGDYKDITTTVSELKNLRTIGFTSTKLKGFDFLQDIPIESFANYGGRVKEFKFLQNIHSLRKLFIKTNSKIDSIDFIEQLPNLEEINLQYISKVVRFPKCDHLVNLRRLYAFQCNRLEDISEVKKLKNCDIYIVGNSLPNRHYIKNI
ncbi:hypothetical protein [uncultured Pontibacter sp.]|uniref:hypothetical protein n=1 Tax=uncultured Pontibacter sp. TaxID=453356 RepID=UPI002633C2FE|nr:hypothetical protein [uncultured Pontibacter sp.]